MQALLLKLLAPLLSNFVGSVIRTALAVLSGYLINKGITDQAHVNTLVGGVNDIVPGLVLYLIAQAASFANKKIP